MSPNYYSMFQWHFSISWHWEVVGAAFLFLLPSKAGPCGCWRWGKMTQLYIWVRSGCWSWLLSVGKGWNRTSAETRWWQEVSTGWVHDGQRRLLWKDPQGLWPCNSEWFMGPQPTLPASSFVKWITMPLRKVGFDSLFWEGRELLNILFYHLPVGKDTLNSL